MTSVNPDLQLNHTPGHVKHDGHNMTGFVIFLCSESVIFLAFFAGYAVLKLTAPQWLPDGVAGLEVRMPLINTVVLVSSSFVAYFAERYLHQRNLWGFRAVWLLTMAMGSYFVYGQYVGMVGAHLQPRQRRLRRDVLPAHRLSRTARDHRHPADGPDAGAFLSSGELRQGRNGRRFGEPVLALRRCDLDHPLPPHLRLAVIP